MLKIVFEKQFLKTISFSKLSGSMNKRKNCFLKLAVRVCALQAHVHAHATMPAAASPPWCLMVCAWWCVRARARVYAQVCVHTHVCEYTRAPTRLAPPLTHRRSMYALRACVQWACVGATANDTLRDGNPALARLRFPGFPP